MPRNSRPATQAVATTSSSRLKGKPLNLLHVVACAVALLATGPAMALYKIVGPDGSVTYTDRPPAGTAARVTSMGRAGDTASTAAASNPNASQALPAELRAVAARFPVTLFAAADCAPCDTARQYLVQRGVPFSEKRVASEEDALELERLLGARTVPSLTIGAQALRGYSNLEWASFLDVAGYPKEARTAVTAPGASPLTQRSAARNATAAPATPAPAAAPLPPTAPAAPSQERIRF